MIELNEMGVKELKEFFIKSGTKWIKMNVPAESGLMITRCRLLRSRDEFIESISELSYCPASKMKPGVFNRCNLPMKEMFYGTLRASEDSVIQHAMITSICEVSSIYQSYLDRCEPVKRAEYILAGHWRLRKSLSAILICDADTKCPSTIFEEAKPVIENTKFSFADRAVISAFDKMVKNNEDYKLTACFSEAVFKDYNINAIIYPSVKARGDGLCIAIRPSFIDNGGMTLESTSKYVLCLPEDKHLVCCPYERGLINPDGSIDYYPRSI